MGKFFKFFKCFIVIYLKCLENAWLLTEEERTSSGCDESCIWLSGQDKTSGPIDVNRKDWMLTERIGFVNRKDWTPGKFDAF